MVNVHGITRLGALALGLGIGAAWAHGPVASADSSGDWLSTIDSLLGGASPASASPLDLAISFDGYNIFDSGNANAGTLPGDYSLAIAYGDESAAYAEGPGGLGVAVGSGAYAASNDGTGDVAEAIGTNAYAGAGGAGMALTGSDYDTAIDIGNNTAPVMYGSGIGAFAGNSDLNGGTDGGLGSHDTAIDIGNNTGSSDDGAFAGAGALGNGSGDGNHDFAIDVGNNDGGFDGAFSVEGNGNYASDSGNNAGDGDYIYAGQGNDNTAIGAGNTLGVDAYGGDHNYAYVDGPSDSTAIAYDGDSNIAYVFDPFGAAGSDSATAGGGFSHDLAELLFTHGGATADTANLLYDIVSLFGHFSGSF